MSMGSRPAGSEVSSLYRVENIRPSQGAVRASVGSLRFGRRGSSKREYKLFYCGNTETRPDNVVSDVTGRVCKDPGGDILESFYPTHPGVAYMITDRSKSRYMMNFVHGEGAPTQNEGKDFGSDTVSLPQVSGHAACEAQDVSERDGLRKVIRWREAKGVRYTIN